MRVVNYTVEGEGTFPFDMLTLNKSWPQYSDRAGDLAGTERRRVTLTGELVNSDGWTARGWRVVIAPYGRAIV